jgi:hypothetical protein
MSATTPTSRRDTIQISLGPRANAITAHLLNLQGLAATTSNNDYDLAAICDAPTTHCLEHNVLVPRVLMIDEPSRFPEQQQQQPQQHYNQHHSQQEPLHAFWDPHRIEPLESSWSRTYYTPQLPNFLDTASTLAYSSHSRYYQQQQPQQQQQQAFSYKIDSSNSRHVNWDEEEEEEEEQEQEHPDDRQRRLQRERFQWQNNTQQPLEHQLSEQWYQGMMSTTTTATLTMTETQQPEEHQQQPLQDNAAASNQTNKEASLTWMDFWMPPYSRDKSLVALPYSQQSHMVAHWDSYHQAATTTSANSSPWSDWKQDELSERLRVLLEESDYCQGFTITTEGHGCYAGLTTSLLYDLQDECKSAGRMVFHVVSDPPPDGTSTLSSSSDGNNNNTKTTATDQIATDENLNPSSSPAESSSSSSSWQPENVKRVRKHVQSGLALSDFLQNANVVLPLQLDHGGSTSSSSSSSPSSNSLFRASAIVAMALESSTLPFRFRPCLDDSRYKVGLQNAPFFGHGGSGGDDAYFKWGTTAQRLSFGEFLTSLQPSSQYKLVELDMALPPSLMTRTATTSGSGTSSSSSKSTLWDHLVAGTSVERDQRMRDDGRDGARNRPREVPPGGWLEDTKHGGLLSSCSIAASTTTSSSSSLKKVSMDRSLHRHFSLASSVRPSNPIPQQHHASSSSSSSSSSGMSQYLTCMVEGMGIRYRPERSMCTVVNQSFSQLTQGGYGAGMYWETILAPHKEAGTTNSSSVACPPVLAVLGNTTRIYPQLHQVSENLKQALGRFSKLRGLYNRDVMNGVLPEEGDCEEAMAACLDIRDIYQPPDGSGLVDDQESIFFDDGL